MGKSIKRLTLMGVMTALAMLFSYVESLVPSFLPIPGARIGLANIVVLLCLYVIGPREAFIVGIVRILLSALLFGNIFSLCLSISGFVFSFLLTVFLYKRKVFSIPGISSGAGAFHNFGQVIAASFIVGNSKLLSSFVWFGILGIVTGILTGFICKLVYERIFKYDWIS